MLLGHLRNRKEERKSILPLQVLHGVVYMLKSALDTASKKEGKVMKPLPLLFPFDIPDKLKQEFA